MTCCVIIKFSFLRGDLKTILMIHLQLIFCGEKLIANIFKAALSDEIFDCQVNFIQVYCKLNATTKTFLVREFAEYILIWKINWKNIFIKILINNPNKGVKISKISKLMET